MFETGLAETAIFFLTPKAMCVSSSNGRMLCNAVVKCQSCGDWQDCWPD